VEKILKEVLNGLFYIKRDTFLFERVLCLLIFVKRNFENQFHNFTFVLIIIHKNEEEEEEKIAIKSYAVRFI